MIESLRRQRAPVTIGLIAAWIVVSLGFWFSLGRGIETVGFGSADWLLRPWSLLTYPFAFTQLTSAAGILCFLFLCFWFFMAGGNVEREVGSRKFIAFFAVATALGGLSLWAVSSFGARFEGGPTLPVAAVTLAWCARNPSSIIRLYGIIPISGRVLAVGSAVIVLLVYGFGSPIVGLAALAPLLLGHLFGMDKVPFLGYGLPHAAHGPSRAEQERQQRYFDEVRLREKERVERERLRELFERSGIDDD